MPEMRAPFARARRGANCATSEITGPDWRTPKTLLGRWTRPDERTCGSEPHLRGHMDATHGNHRHTHPLATLVPANCSTWAYRPMCAGVRIRHPYVRERPPAPRSPPGSLRGSGTETPLNVASGCGTSRCPPASRVTGANAPNAATSDVHPPRPRPATIVQRTTHPSERGIRLGQS